MGFGSTRGTISFPGQSRRFLPGLVTYWSAALVCMKSGRLYVTHTYLYIRPDEVLHVDRLLALRFRRSQDRGMFVFRKAYFLEGIIIGILFPSESKR